MNDRQQELIIEALWRIQTESEGIHLYLKHLCRLVEIQTAFQLDEDLGWKKYNEYIRGEAYKKGLTI